MLFLIDLREMSPDALVLPLGHRDRQLVHQPKLVLQARVNRSDSNDELHNR